MPRIRTVKPEFFKHYDLYLAEKESGLPLRLGFQGLWLCADKQGVFRWQPEVLKLDILPYDEIDFKKLLEFLLKEHFIGSFRAADGKHYGIIPSFQDHQRINGTEKVNPPIYPSPSTDYNSGSIEAILGSTKEALGMDGREGKGREKEGKGRDIPTRQETRASPEFEAFKKSYPKRGGANPWKPAEPLFEKAIKGGTSAEMLARAAEAYRAECQRSGIIDTEKIAQAVTWLRQERYSDYLQSNGAVVTPLFDVRKHLV